MTDPVPLGGGPSRGGNCRGVETPSSQRIVVGDPALLDPQRD